MSDDHKVAFGVGMIVGCFLCILLLVIAASIWSVEEGDRFITYTPKEGVLCVVYDNNHGDGSLACFESEGE